LNLLPETEAYEVKGLGPVPFVDVAGTFDSQKGESCLLVLNRDLAKPRELELVWREAAPARVVRAEVLTGDDLRAVNTFAQPQRISPRLLETGKPGARMVVELPPRSYSVLVMAAG
jgi:alpha-N-arabinofuranosidase